MMKCKSRASENEQVFGGEVAIHFRGLKGLDKPIVWVFPKLLVCLNCGMAEFPIPEGQLRVHAKGEATAAAGSTWRAFPQRYERGIALDAGHIAESAPSSGSRRYQQLLDELAKTLARRETTNR